MEDIKIKNAEKKDFNAIANLIKVEYLKHYNEKWDDENALKTLEYYNKIGKIFVADLEDKVIGVVIIREEYYNDGKSLMVEELVVNGELQKKGIGKQLMQFVEDYCKENKIGFIWLITSKTAPAFEFYKKIGYIHKEKTVYFSKEIKDSN